jgi:hypothetical protein
MLHFAWDYKRNDFDNNRLALRDNVQQGSPLRAHDASRTAEFLPAAMFTWSFKLLLLPGPEGNSSSRVSPPDFSDVRFTATRWTSPWGIRHHKDGWVSSRHGRYGVVTTWMGLYRVRHENMTATCVCVLLTHLMGLSVTDWLTDWLADYVYAVEPIVPWLRWSHRPVIAEGVTQTWETGEIYGGESSTRSGFPPSTSVSPTSIIPPLLHTHSSVTDRITLVIYSTELVYFTHRTMDKVHKTITTQYYTPSSKPFRINFSIV